jgi:hypothetical protein
MKFLKVIDKIRKVHCLVKIERKIEELTRNAIIPRNMT